MTEMPLLYQKILAFLRENQDRPRFELENDLITRFRLNRQELRQAIDEMKIWGTNFENTQRRIRVKE